MEQCKACSIVLDSAEFTSAQRHRWMYGIAQFHKSGHRRLTPGFGRELISSFDRQGSWLSAQAVRSLNPELQYRTSPFR